MKKNSIWQVNSFFGWSLTLVAISILNILNAQPSFSWAKKMGAIGEDDAPAVATDNDGNIYTIVNFENTSEFNAGGNSFTLTSNGLSDVAIVKYDVAGNLLWAKSVGGVSNDFGRDVALDNTGNVFISGNFRDVVDFNPGAGVAQLTSVAGQSDFFILKLNASGDFVWAKLFTGPGYKLPQGLMVGAAGNIYCGGIFQDSVDFDPGSGTATLSSAGSDDIFILKLDTLGDFLWAKRIGGTDQDRCNDIALGPDNGVYFTGSFRGTCDFHPGPQTVNLNSAGSEDIFVAKLSTAGNYVFAKRMGGTSIDEGMAVAVDDAGNVYTTGGFRDTVDFQPGSGTFNLISSASSDIFISKLDTAGNFVWSRQIEGSDYERGEDIALDAANNVYTIGNYYSYIDFDVSSGYDSTSSTGVDAQGFIHKLDANGNYKWSAHYGDGTGYVAPSSLSLNDGKVYTVGNFSGTTDFNPSSFASANISDYGNGDAFIQKMIYCSNTLVQDTIYACGAYTWIDGNTYTTNNNSASFTIPKTNGCDSVVMLHLTITDIDETVSVNSSTLSANETGASYQWLDCATNLPLPNSTNQSFAAQQTGLYAVEITRNGCVDTSNCITVQTTSISDYTDETFINVFPNPSKGNFVISIANDQKFSMLRIFDATGRKQMELPLTNNRVMLGELSSGMYLIEIISAEKTTTKRLVIE